MDVAEQLTFTAYTDLVLARLYEAEQRYGPSRPIDAYELMADITDQGVEREWAWDAAKWIIDHGLGHDFLTMGSATTKLTGESSPLPPASTRTPHKSSQPSEHAAHSVRLPVSVLLARGREGRPTPRKGRHGDHRLLRHA
jgi:hypothetical protein